jgi:uncharacterized protein (DUF1800 family)
VKKLWARLFSREVAEGDAAAITELAAAFAASNYNLRQLMRALVTRPEYVQGELFGARAEVQP